MSSTIITGLFETPADAAAAINSLEARGIPAHRISLIAAESLDRDTFAVTTHSKLSEGVAVGATTGAAVGALVAGLTAVGAVATGGLGLIAAGPLVAALTGAGAGATGGGVLGALVGIALPEHEIKHVEDALEKGSVLVGVECETSEDKAAAKAALKDADALKISHA